MILQSDFRKSVFKKLLKPTHLPFKFLVLILILGIATSPLQELDNLKGHYHSALNSMKRTFALFSFNTNDLKYYLKGLAIKVDTVDIHINQKHMFTLAYHRKHALSGNRKNIPFKYVPAFVIYKEERIPIEKLESYISNKLR